MEPICLTELLSDPFSSYKSMTSVRSMCLPPRYIGNISEGIRNQLDSEINLFSRELDSVIVSYENIKLLQSVANIVDDLPFLQFRIQADYIVFKPTIGCLLKGVVNKVSKDHVGCLVHKRFNASIHRPQQNLNGWRGSKLQQGEEFPFQVVDIFSNNAVVSLKGKLVDQKVIATYLKSLNKDKSSDCSKSPESVHIDSEGDITLENEPILGKPKRKASEADDTDLITEPPHKKKKSKRKSKSFEDHNLGGVDLAAEFDKSNSSLPEDPEIRNSKKKKKRKHSDGKLSQDDSFAEDDTGNGEGRKRCKEVFEKRKESVKQKHEDRKNVVDLPEINYSDSEPSVEKRRKVSEDRSDLDLVDGVEHSGVVRGKKKKKKKDKKRELEIEGQTENGDVNFERATEHLEAEVENVEIDSRKLKKKKKHKHKEMEIPVSPDAVLDITAPSSEKKKKKKKRRREEAMPE